jgi:hypothetical protein
MDFLWFIFFSAMEYFSSLMLLLTLFRFNVKEHFTKFLISSIILSIISNSLIQQGLESVSSLLQLLLFLFLVTIILRVNLVNSGFMVITTYFIFGVVQTTLLMIYLHFGIIEKAEPYQFSGYLLQATSSCFMFLFSIIIARSHGGFSFVDQRSSRKPGKTLFNKSNRQLLIAMAITVVVFILMNLLYFYSKHPNYLVIAIIFIMNMVTLLYLSVRRDT